MDFEKKHAQQVAKSKGQSPLLCRSGATVVRNVPRMHRAINAEHLLANVPALSVYERGWVVVEHLDLKYRSPPQLPPRESLPALHYEVDGDLPAAQCDVPQSFSALVTPVVDVAAEEARARDVRATGRLGLRTVYPMMAEEFLGVDLRAKVAPSEERPGPQLRVQLTALELHMGPGIPEPLFCTISMWDVARGRKLSDDFVCHLNDAALLSRAGLRGPYCEAATATTALFAIPERVADVVLLAHVTKTLQGNTLDHVLDHYVASPANPKTLAKLRAELDAALPVLGRFSQPLGFAVVPLFGADGSLLAGNAPPSTIYAWPRSGGIQSDFVTQKIAPLLQQDARDRKMRVLPGALSLSLVEVDSAASIPGRLSACGAALRPAGSAAPVLEMQPFFDDAAHCVPRYEFSHLLFVSPLTLNFSKYSGAVKGRNLIIEVSLKDNDMDALSLGVPLVLGRACAERELVTSEGTSVTYHERKPVFCEEFKIKLPLPVKPGCHVHFLISHVNCKVGAGGATGRVKTPVGFAWLPLLLEGGAFLSDTVHQLAVSASFPSRYMAQEVETRDLLKWVERRPLLAVAVRSASSVYPADPALRFFVGEPQPDEATLEQLSLASDAALMRDLPVVLDCVFRAIASHDMAITKAALHQLLGVLVRVTNAQTAGQARNPLVDSYLGYCLELPRGATIGALLNWLQAVAGQLRGGAALAELVCRFGWVVCDATVKWLVLWARANNTLGDDQTRSTRFPPSLHDAVRALLDAFIKQLHVLSEEKIAQAMELSKTLAYFVIDLLCVLDRGFVLELIGALLDGISSGHPGASLAQQQLLQSCKMDALSVVCSHEDFVGLNLPPLGRVKHAERLLKGAADRHRLVTILIRTALEQQHSPDKAVRLLAMSALRNQLVKHSLDARYQKASLQGQIVAMYFPFVAQFVAERDRFWALYDLEEKRTALFCVLHVLAHAPSSLLVRWWATEPQATRTLFFQLLCRCILTFEYRGRSHVGLMVRDFTVMKLSRVKQLSSLRGGNTYRGGALASPRSGASSTDGTPSDANSATSGEMRAWKKQAGTNTVAPRAHIASTPAGDEPSTEGAVTRSWKAKLSTSAAASLGNNAVSEEVADVDAFTIEQEKHLSRESMLTVLDVLMMFVEHNRDALGRAGDPSMALVVEVMVHLLHVHHTDSTFGHIAAALRLLVGSYRAVFFVHATGYAQQLTYRLLTLFNSQSGSIRHDAAAMVYLLMRENWLARGDCQRMKLALTVGINRTSDPSIKVRLSESAFEGSLAALSQCAATDPVRARLPSGFDDALREVSSLMLTVLRNMVRIRQFAGDPERLADLHQQLCDSYRNSPDLRATWLHTLASLHESQRNFEEAAQCRIHLSALISAYLRIVKPRESVPVDRLAFSTTAPNIAGEFDTPAANALDEGICQSDVFTRVGLFTQLEESVALLKRDSLFESCLAVERLMGAIHHRNRDWVSLSARFGELGDLCARITQADAEHSRMFAKWYRVGLFGDAFGDQAGARFVYKERADVMISSIVERLVAQYGDAFGAANVHVLSNTDNAAALDMQPGHAYLQIGAVSPFFEPGESVSRATDFERQTNVCKFVMETPFTKSGGAHGNWDEQCMRKTIVTVQKSFPYILKRLAIVSEETFVLHPIENALSVIQERVASLQKQVDSTRPSTKSVQQFLSGSVLLQVNPGPLVICEVFLAPANAAKYSATHVGLLRKCMAQFVVQSRALLLLNGALIDSSQMDYQVALTQGYNDMRNKLEPFLAGETIPPPVDVPTAPGDDLESCDTIR